MLHLLPNLASIPGLFGGNQALRAAAGGGQQSPGILGSFQRLMQQDPMTMMAMGGALMSPGDPGQALMRAGMIGAQGAQRRRDRERQEAAEARQERLDQNMLEQQQWMRDFRTGQAESEQSRFDTTRQDRLAEFERAGQNREQDVDFRERQFQASLRPPAPERSPAQRIEDQDGNDYFMYRTNDWRVPTVFMRAGENTPMSPQEVQATDFQTPTTRQQVQEVGAPAETEFARFRQSELAMGNTLAYVDRLQQIATQDPAAITAGGSLSADLRGLADNATRAMNLMINGNHSDADRTEETAAVNRAINMGSIRDNQGVVDFGSLGMEELNAQARSVVVSLAYARAKQADPGGRISDRDLLVQIQSLGIGQWTRTPEQIGAVLGMIRDESIGAYNRHGQQLYGDRWTEEGMLEGGLRQYAPGVNPLRYTDPDAYAASLLNGGQ